MYLGRDVSEIPVCNDRDEVYYIEDPDEVADWVKRSPYFIKYILKYIIYNIHNKKYMPSKCHTHDFGLYIDLLVGLILGECSSKADDFSNTVIEEEINKLIPGLCHGLNFFPVVGGIITGPTGYVILRACIVQIEDEDDHHVDHVIQITREVVHVEGIRSSGANYLAYFDQLFGKVVYMIHECYSEMVKKNAFPIHVPGLDASRRLPSDKAFIACKPCSYGIFCGSDGDKVLAKDPIYYEKVWVPGNADWEKSCEDVQMVTDQYEFLT